MGYLSYAEPPHNRHSLPHTPPDLVNYACSPSTSSRGLPPPKDLSWPHPKPPISPPMSSHDQPPPPPSARRSRSPPRTASPSSVGGGSISGGMSMSATAAASLARASISAITSAAASAEDRKGSTTTPSTATPTSSTTTAATTSLTSSPRHDQLRLPGAAAAPPPTLSAGPLPERLPSLTSIFGPSPLDRPLPPTSAPSSGGPPSLISGAPTSAYGQRPSYQSYDQHGRPPSPGSAYLPPPQSAPSRDYHQQHQQHYQHHDQHSPRSDERQPVNRQDQPPSPRSHEYDQQQQQQQQRHSHQWPDSRSDYVAVGKWSLQDGPKTERSYNDSKPSAPHHQQQQQQHSPGSHRYTQPLPPPSQHQHQQEPSSSNDYYRQQHRHQQGPPPPSQSYSSHKSAPLPPPPPQQQQHQQHASRSPVRGPAPVADGRHSSGSVSSMPSTPASGAFPEAGAGAGAGAGGVPKETLAMGPKIWTGVDFLPQFMHASEVPGEGTCYFYDDGTHCKAVIDGEAVNPYWGVTKAGKPRKRLAIACMTCREKKIKCDPEYPRCVQCDKFGRVCRFKNAPRGGNNNSPGAASSEPDAHRRISSGNSIRLPPESPSASGPIANNKRMRQDYDHYTTASRSRSPPFSNRSPTLSNSSSSADPICHNSTGSGSVLPPPIGWGSSSNQQSQSSPLPPPPSSYPRSIPQQPYSPHSPYAQHGQLSPRSQYPPQQPPPPTSSYDHHRSSNPYPDHHRSHHHTHSQPRSQPGSPSQPDLPRMLLPPPRSAPDLPRVHDDVLRRSWQSDMSRPHGRA